MGTNTSVNSRMIYRTGEAYLHPRKATNTSVNTKTGKSTARALKRLPMEGNTSANLRMVITMDKGAYLVLTDRLNCRDFGRMESMSGRLLIRKRLGWNKVAASMSFLFAST